MPDTPTRPPLLLIASDQEWSSRALETALGPQGYAILRSYNRVQTFDLITRGRPDLVLISDRLPDSSGYDLCRLLREEKIVSDSTGILLIVPAPVTRDVRIEALRAGASDTLGLPMDGEELGMRLMPYIRAKFDADQARNQGLIDPATGLYNLTGLTRRAREMGSQAYRRRGALTCVIFSPDMADVDPNQVEALEIQIAKALSQVGRGSDAIGRVDGHKIAIFADVREADIEKVMKRLQTAVDQTVEEAGHIPMYTGHFNIPDFRENPANFDEMLFKASAALKPRGRSNGN